MSRYTPEDAAVRDLLAVDPDSWWQAAFLLPAVLLALYATSTIRRLRWQRDRYRAALAQTAYAWIVYGQPEASGFDPLKFVPAEVLAQARLAAAKAGER